MKREGKGERGERKRERERREEDRGEIFQELGNEAQRYARLPARTHQHQRVKNNREYVKIFLSRNNLRIQLGGALLLLLLLLLSLLHFLDERFLK